MTDCQARLSLLAPERFAAFVYDLVVDEWADWRVEAAPPSPAGRVELTLTRGDEQGFVAVRHQPPRRQSTASLLTALAALRERNAASWVGYAQPGVPSRTAARVAADLDVELLSGARLCALAAEHGVALTESGEPTALTPDVARAVAHWPEPLRHHAVALVETLDAGAAFEYETERRGARLDVLFVPVGATAPVARARFTQTTFAVDARGPRGEMTGVLRLSADGGPQPGLSDLTPVVTAAVERALERSGNR